MTLSLQAEMEELQLIVQTVRKIRMKHNISPIKLLNCMIVVTEQEEEERLETHSDFLIYFCRLMKLEIGTDIHYPPSYLLEFSGKFAVIIDTDNVIDVKKVKERLKRQIHEQETIIDKSKKRLLDKKYLANAPAYIVANTHLRVKQEYEKLEALTKEYNALP